MKRVKICSLVTVALMTASMTMPYSNAIVYAKENNGINAQAVSTTEGKVTVESYNQNKEDGGQIIPYIRVKNTSNEAINLEDLKLSYFYSANGVEKEKFDCYDAAIRTPEYRGVRDSVVGNIVKCNDTDKKADRKLEIGFKSGAGTLAPGEALELHTAISKQDWDGNWQNVYKQSDDYSFNPSANDFEVTNKVIAELNGIGPVDPIINTLTPGSTSFTQGQAKDVTVGYKSTGNAKLNAIKNGNTTLRKGTDYTESNGKVTLTKDYLNALKAGNVVLTFDFDNGTDPTFKITVQPPVVDKLTLELGKVEGERGQKVTIPVSVSKLPENGLESYKLVLKYDPSVLGNVAVEAGDSTTSADELETEINEQTGEITVKYYPSDGRVEKDGVLVNVTGTIKSNAAYGESKIEDVNKGELGAGTDANGNFVEYNADKVSGSVSVMKPQENVIKLEVGKVKGEKGQKVELPVNVSKLPTNGLESYKLVLKYDPSVLENVTVEAGESTPTADDLDVEVNEKTGEITVKYYPSGDEKITEDGVLVKVLGTIKSDAKEGESIVEDVNKAELGAGTDANGNFVEYNADKSKGSVTVTKPQEDVIKLEVGKVEGEKGQKVELPVNVSKLPANGLESYKLVLKYDPSVLENVTVEAGDSTPTADDLDVEVNEKTGEITVKYYPSGDEKITEDGVLVKVLGTIKSDAKEGESIVEDVNAAELGAGTDANGNFVEYNADKSKGSVTVTKPQEDVIKLEVGKVEGEKGQKVELPVNVSKLPANGLESYKLVLKYDPSVLENVTVEAGDSTPTADDLDVEVNEKTGEITVKYYPSGDEKITEDGVLVKVLGTIKSDAKEGESIVEDVNAAELGAGTDANGNFVEYNADKSKGSINVLPGHHDGIKLEVGKVEGIPGQKVELPVNVSKLPANGLESYKLVLKYDPSVLENVTVEAGDSTPTADDLDVEVNEKTGEITVKYYPSGDEKVTEDGVLVKVLGTIKSDAKGGESIVEDVNKAELGAGTDANGNFVEYNADKSNGSISVVIPTREPLELEVGKVEGKQRQEVEIPVNVRRLPENGLESYKLVLKYDPSVLENVTVEAGKSTPTEDDLDVEVNDKTGEITVKYYPSGDEKVSEDGVLVKVVGTIKSDAKEGEYTVEEVNAGELGAGTDANGNFVEFNAGKKVKGSVTVVKGDDDKPVETVNTIDKDSVTFEEGKAEDVTVGYTSTKSALSAIKNGDYTLVEGSDYTKSDKEVVLSKDYLNGLKEGEVELTFDFAAGEDLALKVAVTKSDVHVEGVVLTTEAVTVSAGDKVKIPVNLSSLPEAGLGTVSVYISYDPDMFDSVSVSRGSMFTSGGDVISYVDKTKHVICIGAVDGISKDAGTAAYITLKVKSGVGPCTTKLTDGTKLMDPEDTTMSDVNGKDFAFSMQLGDITIK